MSFQIFLVQKHLQFIEYLALLFFSCHICQQYVQLKFLLHDVFFYFIFFYWQLARMKSFRKQNCVNVHLGLLQYLKMQYTELNSRCRCCAFGWITTIIKLFHSSISLHKHLSVFAAAHKLLKKHSNICLKKSNKALEYLYSNQLLLLIASFHHKNYLCCVFLSVFKSYPDGS